MMNICGTDGAICAAASLCLVASCLRSDSVSVAATSSVVAQSEEAQKPSVTGVVRDPRGHPVRGATVALIPREDPDAAIWALTQADGKFVFRSTDGAYFLSATHSEFAGAVVEISNDGSQPVLTLPEGGAFISGRLVLRENRAIEGTTAVRADLYSFANREVYYSQVRPDGRFSIRLPHGQYAIRAESPRLFSLRVPADTSACKELVIQPFDRSLLTEPPPEPFGQWLRSAVVPLISGWTRRESSLSIFRSARIIAAGEASHGARDFFLSKASLFKELVQHHRFRVFAMEESWGSSLAIHDYILYGRGNARDALAGVFGIWNTEEVLHLIEWMREYNDGKSSVEDKIRFFGFDMQNPRPAAAALRQYLADVDPEYTTLAEEVFVAAAKSFRNLDDTKKELIRQKAAAVVRRLEEHQTSYSRARGPEAWWMARQHARSIYQSAQVMDAPLLRLSNLRDEFMADNLESIVRHAGATSRVFV